MMKALSTLHVAVGRVLQETVSSHHPEPRLHIKVPLAACVVVCGGVAFVVASILVFILLQPPDSQYIHPVKQVTPRDAVELKANRDCQDVTNYGQSGLLIAENPFGLVHIRAPMVDAEIQRHVFNMTCQNIISSELVSYSNFLNAILRFGSSIPVCALPTIDHINADIYLTRTLGWESLCEIMLGRGRQTYNTLRPMFPNANSPDLSELKCDINAKGNGSLAFGFGYAWPITPGRPLVVDRYVVSCNTGEFKIDGLRADCTGASKGYPIPDECTSVDESPLADESLADDVAAIYAAREFVSGMFNSPGAFSQLQLHCPGFVSPMDSYRPRYPTLESDLEASLHDYMASKPFSFACASYDYPGFQSHASFVWPVLSMLFTVMLYGIRATYQCTVKMCEFCGQELPPDATDKHDQHSHKRSEPPELCLFAEHSASSPNTGISDDSQTDRQKPDYGKGNASVDVEASVRELRNDIVKSRSATFETLSAMVTRMQFGICESLQRQEVETMHI